MSETFRVPAGCTGLTMSNGTKVKASRRGLVTVPDRYARDVRASENAQLGLVTPAGRATFSRAAGKDCPGCGSEIFRWQACCRRCKQTREDR